jgi:hypothetical protein
MSRGGLLVVLRAIEAAFPVVARRIAASSSLLRAAGSDRMDPLEIVTDRCIRRGLGFAGLAIGVVMLALSFDLPLALRSGADLVAMTAVVMLWAAWQAPRRNMRHSEAWMMLDDWRPEVVRGRPKQQLQDELRRVLRRRMLWHAEKLGLLAVGLWVLTALAMVAKAL